MRWIRSSARALAARAADFLFPPLCIVCDSPRTGGDRWFCSGCLERLDQNYRERDRCPKCSQNRAIRLCACEFVWDHPFESIVSFLDYDDLVAAVMHHVKYKGKRSLAYHMGVLLSAHLSDGMLDGVDLAVPVPLHPSRRRVRGYNQAEWFARGLISTSGRCVLETAAVERTRRTRTQTKLDKADRKANVGGAFRVTDAGMRCVAGKSVLLVDDVVTTGATTGECAQVLLQAGCTAVRVISIARD